MHILQDAVEVNVERAIYNEVEGNQYNVACVPPAPPAHVAQPTSAAATGSSGGMYIGEDAVGVNARHARFNSIRGHQFSDAAALVLSKTGNAPPDPIKPESEPQGMHVLPRAKNVDLGFATFNRVEGNQFGQARSETMTCEMSSQSAQREQLTLVNEIEVEVLR